MDRMIGCLKWGAQWIILANTVPWDGSASGRIDAITKNTEARNKVLVRNFLKQIKPLKLVVAECRKEAPTRKSRTPGTQPQPPPPGRYYPHL